MAQSYKMLIGGEWVDAANGATFEDHNPYNGEVFANVASGTRVDATRAIEAADRAFAEWRNSPPAMRRNLFLKAADIFEKRQDELVRVLSEETGSTIGIAMFQMMFVPGLLREAAAQAYSVTGETIPADYPGAFFMTIRQPAGVVAGFGPFNVPYILCTRAIALPIAYGNTAVLKPSEEAPVSGGVLIGEIFQEAGLPARRAEHPDARQGRRGRGGRRADREPGGAPYQLHRLDGGRDDRCGEGGALPEARRAGAGRQGPAADPARRGRRLRGGRGGLGLLPAPGPDLHVDGARALSSGRSRRSSPRS